MMSYRDWVTTPPLLFVVSGPSGVGKTSLCKRLVEDLADGVYSISATTRPKRPGDKDGEEYFFRTQEEFEALKAEDQLLEWAQVHDHHYGTPRSFVDEQLGRGKVVVLNIDVQGGLQLMSSCPDGVFVFLVPPNPNALDNRIRGRGEDTEAVMAVRMRNARDEIALADRYQYVVVNDDFEECLDRLKAIVPAERSLRRRCYRPAGGTGSVTP
jgi:guanylate kinase